MNRQICILLTDKKTDRQTDRYSIYYRCINSQIDYPTRVSYMMDRKVFIDRRTDGRTDGRTDELSDRQTDMQLAVARTNG